MPEGRLSARRGPLLTTKLYIPPRRATLVSRPRLSARLQQVFSSRLTLLSAPPGFGKTTLLSEWIPQSPYCVTWLSLDAEDNDPTRFWSYFVAALQMLRPDLGEDALALLTSPPGMPIESALTTLLNAIAVFPDTFALVLDDYHVIESPAIHAELTFLLDHLPPQMHLIATTRVDPPLPLARLRARNDLLELRAADLRFTIEEAAIFLNRVMGLNLSGDDIAALDTRTEGWIAGLQLAALSMCGRDDLSTFIASFTGSHRFVLDYLGEQVLQQQSKEIQDFLLRTSILERLSGPLCDAVTGSDNGQRVLEQLEHGNLFLVSLDEERRWYRYHLLFAEMLRAHLQRSVGSAAVQDLHLRASEWQVQHGLTAEAIHHALAAQDFDRAARLIEQAGESVALSGQVETTLGWLAALPDGLVRARPRLSILYALALMVSNRVEAGLARLEDAERAAQSDASSDLRLVIEAWSAILRGELALQVGDLDRCIAISREALNRLPSTETLRLALLVRVGREFELTGDVTAAAERQLAATRAPLRKSGNLFTFLNSVAFLARLQALQGHLHQAVETCSEASDGSARTAIVISPAYYFVLGDILREWNDLEGAESLLTQGMALTAGTLSVDADVLALGYITQARVERGRRDLAAARKTLDAFARLAEDRQIIPRWTEQAAAVRAQIELELGNLPGAAKWAEGWVVPTPGETGYANELEYLTLARIRMAQGKRVDGIAVALERRRQAAEAQGRMSSVVEILTVQALALQAQGDSDKALAALARALDLAEPEGYIRLFVDKGEFKPLLAEFQPSSQELEPYVSKLLAAYGGAPASGEATGARTLSGALIEPLSEREIQVLRLIAAGASNQEIANALVISIATVKRHITNVYGKLEVTSRTQAVARARELHIL